MMKNKNDITNADIIIRTEISQDYEAVYHLVKKRLQQLNILTATNRIWLKNCEKAPALCPNCLLLPF